VAIAAKIKEAIPKRYETTKNTITAILRTLPPDQRLKLLVEIAREVLKGDQDGSD
jgi:hypothetical protein